MGLGTRRVHIIPIGNDDKRRIILPLKKLKPDRIYIITKSGKDHFEELVKSIHKDLIESKLLPEEEIIIKKTDYYDFFKIQATIAEIFAQELDNEILFNASTGGKMLCTAGYLCCMLFGGIAYYCKKDYVNDSIPDNPEILKIPDYQIEPPSENLIRFLLFLKDVKQMTNLEEIPKRQILEIMGVIENLEIKGTPGEFNKLNSRYIRKLESFNYIRESSSRPRTVKILKQGERAIEIFDAYYKISRDSSYKSLREKLKQKIEKRN